jgi:(2R)-ethylmalonyl-CoA mutase
VPLIIGGIIPDDDAQQLLDHGVQAVFTPKDVDMNLIMANMVDIIRRDNGLEELA